MTVTRVVIYVAYWVLLSPTEGLTAGCRFHDIQSRSYGQACETREYINISVAERRHCTLSCIHSTKCEATVFDIRQSVCMLLEEPCILLKPRIEHVYQSFKFQCSKWVPSSDDIPGLWLYEKPRNKANVVRKMVKDDLVLGKVSDQFHAVLPNGTSCVHGGNYEKLVVDASCRVNWVSYDATSGQPLPKGALIGGFLAVTNTPLYVSKFRDEENGQPIHILSYYNPLNHMAWGEYYAVKNNSTFDILTIRPPPATP